MTVIRHQNEKVKSWKLRVFHLHIRTIDSVRVLRIYRVGCRNHPLKQIKSCTLLEPQHEMLQFRNDMVGKFRDRPYYETYK